MLTVAVGHSQDVIAELAAKEVVAQCREQLDGAKASAGILFAAIDFAHEDALRQIVAAFPGIALIGCTTDGELSSGLGFQEDSLALLVFSSETIEFGAGLGEHISKDPALAAKTAVAEAREHCTQTPSLCFVMPDSLTASCSELLECIQGELGDAFPIFGGIAGDQWRFDGTFQFYGERKVQDALPLLLVSGPLLFSHGMASGWIPMGKKGCVTKAEGNVVFSIDDANACDFFHYYLGSRAIPSGEYPLAVFESGCNEPSYMRAPLFFDPETRAVTFAGDIPEGAVVQITNANRQSILEASEASAIQALERYPGTSPSLVFLISCAARKLFLGTRTSEEVDIVTGQLPDTPYFGFYAYGEIGSSDAGLPAQFHNETLITLLLGA